MKWFLIIPLDVILDVSQQYLLTIFQVYVLFRFERYEQKGIFGIKSYSFTTVTDRICSIEFFAVLHLEYLHYFKNITKNLTVRKPMKSFITFFFEISMWYTLTHRTPVNNVHCLNVQYYNYIYYMLNDINYMILKYSYTGL